MEGIFPLALIARVFRAVRDYRRSLIELDALNDQDLRDTGVARDAIAAVAWNEACRTFARGAVRDASAPSGRAAPAPVMVPR